MNNKESQYSLEKATAYAFLLLKFRSRSEHELYTRLKKKGFLEPVIKDTLVFLKEKRFVDDHDFAKSWAQARIKRAYGPRRIRAELKLKGIKEETIADIFREDLKDYQPEKIISALAQKRLRELKGIDLQKAKRRTYAYLLRRGFHPEAISDILNRV